MDEKLWQKCVEFHGHECGGLMTGFKAAQYAAELLALGRSPDEETVCISENDACGVDAIQVVLGCTVGKGNLLFHLTGKQAYTFYERASGRGVRIAARPKPEGLKKGGTLEYMRSGCRRGRGCSAARSAPCAGRSRRRPSCISRAVSPCAATAARRIQG